MHVLNACGLCLFKRRSVANHSNRHLGLQIIPPLTRVSSTSSLLTTSLKVCCHRAFVARNYHVSIVSRSRKKLDLAVEELKALAKESGHTGQVYAAVADVGDCEQVGIMLAALPVQTAHPLSTCDSPTRQGKVMICSGQQGGSWGATGPRSSQGCRNRAGPDRPGGCKRRHSRAGCIPSLLCMKLCAAPSNVQ